MVRVPIKRRKAQALERQRASRALNRSIFAAFFLSGLAGLMHEVVWAKLLVQLIGATAYAQEEGCEDRSDTSFGSW